MPRILRFVYRRFFRSLFEREVSRILLEHRLVWGDPSRIRIDPTALLNNALLNTSSGEIFIEKDVFFGHNVSVITGVHRVELFGAARMFDTPKTGRDVIIRRGVWVASNAVVLGPCEIGEDAVVAAGAVVTGNVPPRTIVAGVPAKVVRAIPAPQIQV
jgi:acetyltransferase-like isoleucine patch superfamily enzyme